MIRVGLTGGIGSGKSTIAKIFETLGIPVYYADDAAKELMNSNEDLKQSVMQPLHTQLFRLFDRQRTGSLPFWFLKIV